MSKITSINSESYWDGRFSDDWESCEGPRQSRFFSRIALENLPSWLIEKIRIESLTLADWGCAQGDGTDVWASHINPAQLTGIDFSEIAIKQAASRYPSITFLKEDWLDSSHEKKHTYDIVFSSNTLEHFSQPYSVLNILSFRAKKSIILALPYRELDRISEHFYSFLPQNIPLELENGFQLIWSKVIDCKHLPNTLWAGDQIILVYAENSWLSSLQLNLHDCKIEHDDTITAINNLHDEISARDIQITNLEQEISTRDTKISDLNKLLAECDRKIIDFEAYRVDKEIYIAQLILNQNNRDNEKKIL